MMQHMNMLNRVWENPDGLTDASVEGAVEALVDESSLRPMRTF